MYDIFVLHAVWAQLPCHDIEIHGLVWVLKASPCDPWNFEDLGRVTLPDGHQVESSTCINWKWNGCQCSCHILQMPISAIFIIFCNPNGSNPFEMSFVQSYCAEGLWSESTRVTLPRGSSPALTGWHWIPEFLLAAIEKWNSAKVHAFLAAQSGDKEFTHACPNGANCCQLAIQENAAFCLRQLCLTPKAFCMLVVSNPFEKYTRVLIWGN